MSASVNKQILIGRIGRDSELRYTSGGTPVARFSVATEKTWTANGEKKSETTWHDVTVWGSHAEKVVTYLTKGKLVYVEGETRKVKFTPSKGPNAGREIEKAEITAENVRLLTPKGDGEAPSTSYATPPNAQPSDPADAPEMKDDDLPF